jgi:TRAP-type C4-dicarboxylate transport system permease small subunit
MDATRRGRAERLFRLIDTVLISITNTALVVIVLTICWTVWTRYVLRTPVVWADDITSLTFAWFIFMGMAAVYNRRGHVSIDIVTSMLPPWLQKVNERAVDIIVGLFCAYTAYLCAVQSVVSNTTAHTPVLELPLSLMFGSMTIGFGLMAIRSVGYLMGVPAIPLNEG